MLNKRITKEDWKAIQQPLDGKTGKVNPKFDEFYKQKTANPFWGTDRDPSKERKEYLNVKKEYDRYSGEMSVRTKIKYEEYLAKNKHKV